MLSLLVSYISLCTVPPVPPTLAIEVLSVKDTDDTRALTHIGSFVSINCKMTEAYTEGNLQVHWSADIGIRDIPTTRPSLTEAQLIIDNATSRAGGNGPAAPVLVRPVFLKIK